MIDYRNMPTDIRELTEIEISFPELPEKQSDPPIDLAQLTKIIVGHQQVQVQSSDLVYLRSALVETKKYWVWSLQKDNKSYYVAVCLRQNGDLCLSFQEKIEDWTVDQFLLGDYHDYFYDHWVQLYAVRYPPDHPAFAGLGF